MILKSLSFVGNIKTSQKSIIIFYDHEVKQSNETCGKDPSLHIIAEVHRKAFKIILINEGLVINIISTTTYKNLNLPFSHICTPTL